MSAQLLVIIGVVLMSLCCLLPIILKPKLRFLYIIPLFISWMGIGAVFSTHISFGSAALVYLQIFQTINFYRLIEQRLRPEYLKSAIRRSWLKLCLQQIVAIIIWYYFSQNHLLINNYENFIRSAWLISSVIMLGLIIKNIRNTKFLEATKNFSDSELPSISLCIPARNETENLSEMLISAVASDYPKLEILVLDDCSQDKTAEIIKQFAHDGVRFVEGSEPSQQHWLHKNWAYSILSAQASGKILIFMGVDIRLKPNTLRDIIRGLLQHEQDMVSIMPLTELPSLSRFFHPLRNWWELVLPRTLLKRPAVLSSMWVIRSQALKNLGGFSAVSGNIIPERFFARELTKTKTYRFLRSSKQLGLLSVKNWSDQYKTALRTRYPQLHRRPEQVSLIIMALLFILGAFVTVFFNFQILLIPTLICLLGSHLAVESLTFQKRAWICIPFFPILILYEVFIIFLSMCLYEFATVTWKGRNICLPTMRVIPNLPKLEDIKK